jgi:hypothetical protein
MNTIDFSNYRFPGKSIYGKVVAFLFLSTKKREIKTRGELLALNLVDLFLKRVISGTKLLLVS